MISFVPAGAFVLRHETHDPHPINDWPARCGEWMKSMGFLDGK